MKHKTKKLILSVFLLTTFYLLPTVAEGATMYIFPQEEEVYKGSSISAEVRLDTEGEEINTIEANVLVLGDEFEIADFSIGGSIFPIFVQGPEIYTEEVPAGQAGGTVFFQAISPGGFNGDGVIGRMVLRAKNTGQGIIKIAENPKVLLNDGNATLVNTNILSTRYRVIERPDGFVIVESKSHPIETQWYGGPFIRLKWEVAPGAEYSYILSRLSNEVPDEVPDEPVGDIKLTTDEEGVFYFHIRECIDGECGIVATKQILRDTSPPEPFEPVIGQEPNTFGGKKFLSFTTTDKYSGVSHFEIFEGDTRYVGKSPYILRNQAYIGSILVKAIDKAGNAQEAVFIVPGESFKYNRGIMFAIIGVVAGISIIYLLWSFLQRKKVKNFNV